MRFHCVVLCPCHCFHIQIAVLGRLLLCIVKTVYLYCICKNNTTVRRKQLLGGCILIVTKQMCLVFMVSGFFRLKINNKTTNLVLFVICMLNSRKIISVNCI